MEKNCISWDILLRKACRTLSPDEEIIFQEWLARDERHKSYYKRISQIWSSDGTTYDLNTDISKMIIGFDDYVREEREAKHRKTIRNVYRYVACLLFLCAVGGGIWLFSKDERSLGVETRVAQEIRPGGGKAIILLANGERVDIDLLTDTARYNVKGLEIKKNLGIIKYNDQQEVDVMYNTIMIPRGGEYQVELSDGTRVWLNSETRLKVPTSFIGTERRVYLSGEAYFDVAKDKEKPFIVETDLGNVKVYGTEFNVKLYQNEKQLKATLVKGLIGFSSDKITELKLKPGYQLKLAEGSETPEIKQVKIYNEIAWRNKQFSFENETLDKIAWDLERWYDVKIVFSDPVLKELVFSGTLNRYGEIESLLQLFEEGVDVKFLIENDTIKVMKK